MVLDKLSDNLKQALRKLTGAAFVDEKLINEVVKDIQRSLLQADVNVQLVFEVAKSIKDRALNEKLPQGLSTREHIVNIVYEELVKFLGGTAGHIELTKQPYIIMLVGLFGNGKTTSVGKIAKYYKKRGKKVLTVQTDTWRPAAYDQLEQLSKQVGVEFRGEKKAKNPVDIIKKYQKEFAEFDVVLIDTAGRDALSDELIEELNQINKSVKTNERLLVMNADVGQSAQKQAQAFHDTCNVTGVIITKLDGTAKGGGALTACAVTKAPVRFIGTGEKVDELEEFKPEGFVGRLLGMGDLESLLEKAKEAFDQKDVEEIGKRMLKGEFNLVDLYDQMQAMRKMGPLSKIMQMVPGLSSAQIPKEMLEVQDERLQKWKYIMDSMARAELEDPDIFSPARIERVSKGSGQSEVEIRSLIKQYKQSKKMVKMMKGMSGSENDVQKLMTKMQRKMGKKVRM